MGSRVFASLVAAVVLAPVSFRGQAPSTPAPAPSPAPSTPSPAPSPSPSPPSPSTPSPGTRTPPTLPIPDPTPPRIESIPRPQQERQGKLPQSGQVVMENGTAPPEPVRIELSCAGRATTLGYTDSKGGFTTTANPTRFADARSPGPQRSTGTPSYLGQRVARGCVLRAVLPGYRSTEISLDLIVDTYAPVILILHPMANVEGRTVSATSLTAPKGARTAFDKGTKAMRKRKWDEAAAHLEKAVESYPRYAAAWSELGNTYSERNENDKARQAFQQAIAIDPKFINPYYGLAEFAMQQQSWEEMAEYTGALLKLDPYDQPGAYAYNALAHLNLNHLDAAEKSARGAVKADTRGEVPKSEHVLGVILMRKGDYTGAVEHFKKYLEIAPKANDAQFVRRQIAECEVRHAARAEAERDGPARQ